MTSETRPGGLVVLSPLGQPEAAAWSYARRPATLAGRRLGLIDNTKYNSGTMLAELAAILKERYGVGEVRAWRKAGPARGVAPEQMAEMRQAGVEVAVAGIGD